MNSFFASSLQFSILYSMERLCVCDNCEITILSLIQGTPQQQRAGSLRVLAADDEGASPHSRGELTRSMTSSVSAVSTRSDITLTHEDDTETVVDEGERGRGLSVTEADSERRNRQDTLTADGGEGGEVGEGGEKREKGENGGQNHTVNEVGEGKEEGKEKEEEVEEVNMRHMSVVFRQELLNTVHLKIDSRIGLEIAKLSDSQRDVVQLVARCLPHIVPNVILAKREVSHLPHGSPSYST